MKNLIVILIIATSTLFSQETIWDIEDADSIKSEIKLSKYKEYFYYKNSNNEYVVRKVEDGSEHQRFTIDGELITINEKFDSYYYHNSGTFTKQEFGGERDDFLFKGSQLINIFENKFNDGIIIFHDKRIAFLNEDLVLIKELDSHFLLTRDEKLKHLNLIDKLIFDYKSKSIIYPIKINKFTPLYKGDWLDEINGNFIKIDSNWIASLLCEDNYSGFPLKYDLINDSLMSICNYVTISDFGREISERFNLHKSRDCNINLILVNKSISNIFLSQNHHNYCLLSNEELITYKKSDNSVLNKIGNIGKLKRLKGDLLWFNNEDTLKLININGNIHKSYHINNFFRFTHIEQNLFFANTNNKVKLIQIDENDVNYSIYIDSKKTYHFGEKIELKVAGVDNLTNIKWEINGKKDIGEIVEFNPETEGDHEIKVSARVNGVELETSKTITILPQKELKFEISNTDGDLKIFSNYDPELYNHQWTYKDKKINNDTLDLLDREGVIRLNYQISNDVVNYSGNIDTVYYSENIDPETNKIDLDTSGNYSITSNDIGSILILNKNKGNLFQWDNGNLVIYGDDIFGRKPIFIDNANTIYFKNDENNLSLFNDEIIKTKINLNGIQRIGVKQDLIYTANLMRLNFYDNNFDEVDINVYNLPEPRLHFLKDKSIFQTYLNYYWDSFSSNKSKVYSFHVYEIFKDKNLNEIDTTFWYPIQDIQLFGTRYNILKYGRRPYELSNEYGLTLEMNNILSNNLEETNIFDYIDYQYYYLFKNEVYKSRIDVTNTTTKINLKGEYIAHSVDLYHTWILTKDGDDYYLTDLNPEEPPTTSVEEISDMDIIIKNNLIELNGLSGEYQIADISGKIVRKSEFNNKINLNNLEQGIYLIQIQTENKTITKKIIRY